ncbi:MAG: hypothetical protein ACTTH5_07315 [Wolinella sp.]
MKKGEWLSLRGTEALGIDSEIFNLGYEKLDANNQGYIQKFNAQKRFGDPLYEGRRVHDGTHKIENREKNYYHDTFAKKQSYE